MGHTFRSLKPIFNGVVDEFKGKMHYVEINIEQDQEIAEAAGGRGRARCDQEIAEAAGGRGRARCDLPAAVPLVIKLTC